MAHRAQSAGDVSAAKACGYVARRKLSGNAHTTLSHRRPLRSTVLRHRLWATSRTACLPNCMHERHGDTHDTGGADRRQYYPRRPPARMAAGALRPPPPPGGPNTARARRGRGPRGRRGGQGPREGAGEEVP